MLYISHSSISMISVRNSGVNKFSVKGFASLTSVDNHHDQSARSTSIQMVISVHSQRSPSLDSPYWRILGERQCPRRRADEYPYLRFMTRILYLWFLHVGYLPCSKRSRPKSKTNYQTRRCNISIHWKKVLENRIEGSQGWNWYWVEELLFRNCRGVSGSNKSACLGHCWQCISASTSVVVLQQTRLFSGIK